MIERELTNLFGADVLQDCWELPTVLKAEQANKVGTLASVLRTAKGPRHQRELVQAMPMNDRLLLCRWLSDSRYAQQCINT